MKILAVGRNRLQQDSVVHAFAFTEDVVYGQSGQHPVLYGILVKHFLVADVVLEPVFLVALDIDAEHILNGVLMPVECAAGQAYALAHLGFQPLPVDFPERDSVRPMNDVHKPDIFLKQCVGSHNEGFFVNIIICCIINRH